MTGIKAINQLPCDPRVSGWILCNIRAFISTRGKEKTSQRMREGPNPVLAYFKDGGRTHRLKNVGNFYKLVKTIKLFFPRAFRKNHSAAVPSILVL